MRVVIIGSGLGGLAVGSVLSRKGYDVIIVEQGARIGGCLQCFNRDGVRFDTGMHVIGSADEGEVVDGYLRCLGIRDEIKLSRLDTEAYDIISIDSERYFMANGHEAMMESLLRHFPGKREVLERYWRTVDEVTAAAPLYDGKGYLLPQGSPSGSAWRSMDTVLDEIAGDSRLGNVLAGNMAFYAARRGATPFATHAFVSQMYNRSAFRIVGGGQSVAEALAAVIERNGGKIIRGCRAEKVLCSCGRATGVQCRVGDAAHTLAADVVVGDIHPRQLRSLFTEGDLKLSYLNRVEQLRNTTSVFALFLQFKPGRVPYLNSNFHAFSQPTVWGMENYDTATWPKGWLYMHHSHEVNPRYAASGVLMAYMNWQEVSRWTATHVGHRGKEYEDWKRQKAERLLDAVEKEFPGLRHGIASYYTASPLTYRDYTLTPQGSMYGIAKDVSLGIAGRVSYRTKVSNFFLTGQNTTAHGIMGVLIGAFNVCSQPVFSGAAEKNLSNLSKISHLLYKNTPDTLRETSDVLVMGGGIGGLFCGAILAKEGMRVTVLERQLRAGGGLVDFSRGNLHFPTGMHVFGGMSEKGHLRLLLRYLGIEADADSLLMSTDADCTDEVIDTVTGPEGTVFSDCVEKGQSLRLPRGKEAYKAYLCSRFPGSRADIVAYVDAMYRLAKEERGLFLSGELPMQTSDEFLWPVGRFMRHYISDEGLRRRLCYLMPLYAGDESTTPAYIHAIINTLHIEGTHIFRQPSGRLAGLLCDIIKQYGGEVRTGEAVTSFSVHDRGILTVRTASGMQYEAARYVSDLPTNILLSVAPQGAFPRSFTNRLSDAPVTSSAFKLYTTLKPGSFHHSRYPIYLSSPDGSLMLTTMPMADDESYAATLTAIVPMSWSEVAQWADSVPGHRPQAYVQWKAARRDGILGIMAKAFPDIADCIENVECASPLTLRDWLGNRDGCLYGLRRDADNMMATQLSPRTKLHNLFLTGQDVNIHGMVGVAMTAILTAEAVLGRDDLRKNIFGPQ